MRIGSLCSGACDGLSLGLEWAGLGPTVWQVEIEEERRANLARHWPEASRAVSDVREAGARNLDPVEVVVCSAPCQDLSSAGTRAGLSGSRSGLWFECLRVIAELHPPFIVVENVASGARNWVPYVRSGLERYGYSSLPIPVAASDLGAPHERRRVFVLAVADSHWSGKPPVSVDAEVAAASEHRRVPDDDRASRTGSEDACATDADQRILRHEPGRSSGAERAGAPIAAHDGPRTHEGWPAEFEVVPRVHGIPGRLVRWLGDSVVPQCAEVVGHVIRELVA